MRPSCRGYPFRTKAGFLAQGGRHSCHALGGLNATEMPVRYFLVSFRLHMLLLRPVLRNQEDFSDPGITALSDTSESSIHRCTACTTPVTNSYRLKPAVSGDL